ncbi:MAG: mechanosensitive ion channel family protein [Wolinella sp.]
MRVLRYFLVIFIATLAFGDENLGAKLNDLKRGYLDSTNIWLSAYKNIKNYQDISLEIAILEDRLKQGNLSQKQRVDSNLRLDTLKSKLELYSNFEKSFADIMRLPNEKEQPKAINLFRYLTNSYQKEIQKQQKIYMNVKADYESALEYLHDYKARASALLLMMRDDTSVDMTTRREAEQFIFTINDDLAYLDGSHDIVTGLGDKLKLYDNILKKQEESYRQNELPKFQFTVAVLLGVFLLIYLLRRIITHHIHDDERRFRILKTANILFLLSIFLVIMFAFSDNILYALTLLGFIGAGIVVSLKELVQNLIGWLYLSFSGLIKVGDRIMLYHENHPVIGDIIAITATKIVLYEGINHTTAQELKRAGRIVFIPNHYAFNHSIFNYTHESMKTLYDLIEIDLDYTSDLKLAESLMLKAILDRTERYIELGKKQYGSLKAKYDLRHVDFKPQIHFSIENDHKAIRMQAWFVSPYRDIMNVRSEVVQEFLLSIRGDSGVRLIGENPNVAQESKEEKVANS